jgi:chloride channel protein, CIC family
VKIPPASGKPSFLSSGRQRLRWWLPLIEWLRPTELQITLVLAGLAGFLGALGSLAFRHATEIVHWVFTGSWGAGLSESFARLPWWQRIVVPTVGGAAAGLVLMFTSRFLKQQRTTDYMEAVVIGDGILSTRQSLLKSLSALFSISSGASIGREGPLVQLAAMLASALGRIVHVSSPRLRLLVACGAAAGIASAYNAPVSGALFVAEVVMGTMSMEVFGPLVCSSVVATLTIRQFVGADPLYSITHFVLNSPAETLVLLGLGCVCGLLSPLYLLVLRGVESWFSLWPGPVFVRLASGGLIVGVLAVWYPQVCGNGYSSVNAVLHGMWPWQELAIILILKIVATSATFGSGAVGGIFTPTLFIGSSVGFLFGAFVQAVSRLPSIQPAAFALIGMGAFLAATTRAPIMAIMLIFEITLDYEVILPLMLACVVAYYTARSFRVPGLYSEALRRKGRWEFDSALRRMRVGDIMRNDPPSVLLDAAFDEICSHFTLLPHNYLYVVDAKGRFYGAISLHDIKRFLANPDLARLVIARDIMREDFPSLGPDDFLTTVFERFARHDGERLPVLSRDGLDVLVGSVSKADALLAFAEQPEMRTSHA